MSTREGGSKEGERGTGRGRQEENTAKCMRKTCLTQFSIHIIVHKADRAFLGFILRASLLQWDCMSA